MNGQSKVRRAGGVADFASREKKIRKEKVHRHKGL